MKVRMNVGEGGIKGLFVAHVEKMVLGLVFVLVALYVFSATKQKTPPETMTNDAIVASANRAKKHVEENETWPILEKQRFATADGYLTRLDETIVLIDPQNYPSPVPLDKPIFIPESKRIDPKLYPVQDLEVTAGYGPLAHRTRTKRGPAAEAETDAAKKEVRPFSMGDTLNMRDRFMAPSGAVAHGYYYVAIKGLVPYKKQVEEYKASFENAAGYAKDRDTPSHFFYTVERAEVDSEGTVGDWAVVGNTNTFKKFAQDNWVRSAEELVKHDFIHGILTTPAPPIVGRDLGPLLLHSMSPREPAEGDFVEEEIPDEGPITPGGPGDIPGAPLGGEGPAVARPVARPADPLHGDPLHGDRHGEVRAVEGDEPEHPEFVLFRYFDFTAEPAKQYKYRVKLFLEDPNDPREASRRPEEWMLGAKVVQRLKSKPESSVKVYWREAVSEASATVSIPFNMRVLLGGVNPGKVLQLAGGMHRKDEMTGEIMVVKWDNDLAMDAPGKVEAARGTVLNFSEKITVLNPIKQSLEQLEDYEFATEHIVLDLFGGDYLPAKRRADRLNEPGEVLLMDKDGNLKIHTQMNDHTAYEEYALYDQAFGDDGDNATEPGTELHPEPGTNSFEELDDNHAVEGRSRRGR